MDGEGCSVERKQQKGAEKREPLCIVGGNINWRSYYGKQYGGVFKKLNIEGHLDGSVC